MAIAGGLFLPGAQIDHQAPQHFGFEFGLGRTRLPLGLILALADVDQATPRWLMKMSVVPVGSARLEARVRNLSRSEVEGAS